MTPVGNKRYTQRRSTLEISSCNVPAVPPHPFGIATGTLNFFRLLGGTIVVAGFGGIVLGTIDASGGLIALDLVARGGVPPQGQVASDFAAVFAWVFAAAGGCLAAAL